MDKRPASGRKKTVNSPNPGRASVKSGKIGGVNSPAPRRSATTRQSSTEKGMRNGQNSPPQSIRNVKFTSPPNSPRLKMKETKKMASQKVDSIGKSENDNASPTNEDERQEPDAEQPDMNELFPKHELPEASTLFQVAMNKTRRGSVTQPADLSKRRSSLYQMLADDLQTGFKSREEDGEFEESLPGDLHVRRSSIVLALAQLKLFDKQKNSQDTNISEGEDEDDNDEEEDDEKYKSEKSRGPISDEDKLEELKKRYDRAHSKSSKLKNAQARTTQTKSATRPTSSVKDSRGNEKETDQSSRRAMTVKESNELTRYITQATGIAAAGAGSDRSSSPRATSASGLRRKTQATKDKTDTEVTNLDELKNCTYLRKRKNSLIFNEV